MHSGKDSTNIPWQAYAALALSTSLVGSYVGLSKLLLTVFPVFLLAWLRFGIAAVLMMTWVKRGPSEPALDSRTRWLLFLESLIGNFLFSICLLFGLRHSSAIVAGVMLAAIPAAVALLSYVFLRERISPRVMGGIALSVAGIALVAISQGGQAAPEGSAASLSTSLGAALILAAVFCEATYVVIGKQLSAQISPRRISALINLWGLALVTPLGAWQAYGFDFGQLGLSSWGLLFFYAAAASMVSVWLWMSGLRHVPAAKAGVFMVFLPVATGLIGLAMGEVLGLVQAAAYGLALAGVLLATWPARRTPG